MTIPHCCTCEHWTDQTIRVTATELEARCWNPRGPMCGRYTIATASCTQWTAVLPPPLPADPDALGAP